MLVRAFTYRNRDLDTTVTKAISGARDGALRVGVDTAHAATRG
jgi:hypothetical protein